MAIARLFTNTQLSALLAAAALTGAVTTLGALRMLPARAEAAALAPDGAPAPAKAGRPVTHFDIGCRDSARTREFYSKLFDWTIQSTGPAFNIQTGAGKGIDGHITSLGHEPQNYVTVYVEVPDIRASLDQAVALGGKKIVGPIRIPTGQFAWFTDPDGNIMGLLQPKTP